MQYAIIFIVIILLIALISWLFPFILAVIGIYLIYRIVRVIRKNRYFNSEEFLSHKKDVDSMVKEFNEISDYVQNIPNNNTFISKSSGTNQAHLATYINTSKQNYKRDKNKKDTSTQNVYSTSLSVVKKASEEPIKYLCKYFNIKANEDDLNQLEEIGTNISRMEATVNNLQQRQENIKNDFNPPKFIKKYYLKELMKKIGANVPEIDIKYAQYTFEYVSAGGNSSQKSVITFNGETVEATANYIADRIKYKNSANAQRALMTNALRTEIKERDDYTCQMCSASIAEQSLLLLEIDHIIPVSKGGLSTLDNLQTLCWKCNRSKSNKIL